MPPTIHALLDDPVMRAYYRQVPRLPATLEWGDPWMIWARTPTNQWGKKLFPTYAAAWSRAVECIKDPARFSDVAVVSRRFFYPPPAHATWERGQEWCSRCRRPTEFRYRDETHHALRGAVLGEDEPFRCYYCGIRRIAMPEYESARI
jgi:DNA-directed RNA polymerase subunit RPC12/RpoP